MWSRTIALHDVHIKTKFGVSFFLVSVHKEINIYGRINPRKTLQIASPTSAVLEVPPMSLFKAVSGTSLKTWIDLPGPNL